MLEEVLSFQELDVVEILTCLGQYNILIPRLKHSNKHIPPSNIIYLIELLKFNFWVACQLTRKSVNVGSNRKSVNENAPAFMHLPRPIIHSPFDKMDGPPVRTLIIIDHKDHSVIADRHIDRTYSITLTTEVEGNKTSSQINNRCLGHWQAGCKMRHPMRHPMV